MFEQTFVDGGKTRKGWTVLVSFIAQMIVLAIAILIPMIYFDALPKSQLTSFLVAPPPPPPPPPPPAAAPPKVVKIIPRQFDAGRLMAPKAVPKEVAMIKEEELPPPSSGGVVGGVPGGVPGGTAGGGIGGIIRSRRAPPSSSSSLRSETGDPATYSRGRQRAAGQAHPPAQADLSAAGQAGAYFRRRKIERHHGQGCYYSESGGRQRTPSAGAGRHGSGETVGVSADSSQRGGGGSGNSDRCEFHVEPVVALN